MLFPSHLKIQFDFFESVTYFSWTSFCVLVFLYFSFSLAAFRIICISIWSVSWIFSSFYSAFWESLQSPVLKEGKTGWNNILVIWWYNSKVSPSWLKLKDILKGFLGGGGHSDLTVNHYCLILLLGSEWFSFSNENVFSSFHMPFPGVILLAVYHFSCQ